MKYFTGHNCSVHTTSISVLQLNTSTRNEYGYGKYLALYKMAMFKTLETATNLLAATSYRRYLVE